jgi:uncharacterized protein YjiS (DUF1127 family)
MLLSLLVNKLNSYIKYREAVNSLSQLEDHELNDLGIDRASIEQVVRGQKIAA